MASQPERQILRLTVHKAKNLKVADGSGLADCYVWIYLKVGGEKVAQKRSPIESQTRFPRWEYDFRWDLRELSDSFHLPMSIIAHIQIWHHNVLAPDIPMGEFRLPFEFGHPTSESREWYSLQPRLHHNDKVSGEILLSFVFLG